MTFLGSTHLKKKINVEMVKWLSHTAKRSIALLAIQHNHKKHTWKKMKNVEKLGEPKFSYNSGKDT